jgi:hypothetical protein
MPQPLRTFKWLSEPTIIITYGGKIPCFRRNLYTSAWPSFLLIALATLGLAYGFWTDTLFINGSAQTGELDVEFWGAWEDGNPPAGGVCTGSIDPEGSVWTVTITNAYPGYGCDLGVNVHNNGTIPVKIQPPTLVSNDSPWPPVVTAYYPANKVLQVGPVSNPDSLAAIGLRFDVPTSVTGNDNENSTYTFSYTVAATKENAP